MSSNHNQIIMPTSLNPGLISVLSKSYSGEGLTDEFIQRWLMQLYYDHMIDPEYLFVSGARGLAGVRMALEASPAYRYAERFATKKQDIRFRERQIFDETGGIIRYPNSTTGSMLCVVALPTLPERTLLVGNLVLPISMRPVAAKASGAPVKIAVRPGLPPGMIVAQHPDGSLAGALIIVQSDKENREERI